MGYRVFLDPHLLGEVRAQLAIYTQSYAQTLLWLPRITAQTPGATPSAGRDLIRHQPTTYSDGTYGVGWEATQNSILRQGYLAPVALTVQQGAILDNANREVATVSGLVIYAAALVLYDAAVAPLAKGDVLVLQTDGRRFVVADLLTPSLTFENQVRSEAALEQRSPDDIIYQIPLT